MKKNPSAAAFKFDSPSASVMPSLFDITPLYTTYPWLWFTPALVPWAIWWLPIPDSIE